MSEKDIQSRTMLALGALPNVRLFRNNVGLGWSGELVSNVGGTVILQRARPVKFGLLDGSADLIGWRTVEIGNERVAQFLSIEMKTPTGTRAAAQKRWAEGVRSFGGLAGFATSPEQAMALIREVPDIGMFA